MPSGNGLTTGQKIPYPLETDLPDGAAQMKEIAERLDALIGALAGQVTNLETVTGPARVRYGYASLTVKGTQGEAILTHAAGWVPDHVLLTPRSGVRPLALTVDTDGATTTQVRVRAYNVDTAAPLADGSTFGVYWTVRK